MAGTIGRFRGWSSGEGKKTKLQRRAGPPEHKQHNLVRTAFPAAHELDDPYLIPTPWVHKQRQLPTLSRAVHSVAIIHTSKTLRFYVMAM